MKITSENDKRRLYGDLAWLWPIISPSEDYVEETEFFSKTIKRHSKIEVKTLPHLCCGGGHNDYTFKKHFKVTGVDISEDMLNLARKLNPEVIYQNGDMRTIRLREYFDKCSPHSQDDVDIVFIENYYDSDPTDTSYEATFIYLICRRGELGIHTDRHLCGIFKMETRHDLLKEVGFEAKQMKFEGDYCPAFVCTKPL